MEEKQQWYIPEDSLTNLTKALKHMFQDKQHGRHSGQEVAPQDHSICQQLPQALLHLHLYACIYTGTHLSHTASKH